MRPGIIVCRVLGLLPIVPRDNCVLRAMAYLYYFLLFSVFAIFCIIRDSVCLVTINSFDNIRRSAMLAAWIVFETAMLCTGVYMKYNESKYKLILWNLVSDFPQLIQGTETKVKKITWVLCSLIFAAISLGIYSAYYQVIDIDMYIVGNQNCDFNRSADDTYREAAAFLTNFMYTILSLMKIQFCILFIYIVIPFSQAFDNLNKSLDIYGSERILLFCRQHKILCDMVVKADKLMSIPMTVVLISFLVDCLLSVCIVTVRSATLLTMIPQVIILVFVCHFSQKLQDKVCKFTCFQIDCNDG